MRIIIKKGVREMKFLYELRKKKGLSQAELAYLSGISQSSLARYERGEMQPTLEVIKKIADVLNVSIEELLNGTGSENWELKIKLAKEGVIEMGNLRTSFDLSVGNTSMAVTVSASYDIWEDEGKFEEQVISELRAKRSAGLKLHKEAF